MNPYSNLHNFAQPLPKPQFGSQSASLLAGCVEGNREFQRQFFSRCKDSQTTGTRQNGSDVVGGRTPKLARLEAALFVSESPLSLNKLTHFAMLADNKECKTLIEELNSLYDQGASAFRIEKMATGFQLMTRIEFAFWLNKMHQRKADLKLSSSAMETLSIVAYRQPLTRADVEAIRGVQSSEMLKQLMERGLVKIVGTQDVLGRPFLYGTSRKFLELFGLHNLSDLPMAEQLQPIVLEEETEEELAEETLAECEEETEETEEECEEEYEDEEPDEESELEEEECEEYEYEDEELEDDEEYKEEDEDDELSEAA